MRAVITVVGKDTVGILAKVSSICAENNVNITEVTQSILDEMFCMIMIADVTKCDIDFTDFSDKLAEYGNSNGLSIHVMNEDIFNSMHRI
ncbi:MAG: ACT domain-containing protein [Eubacterium sp.]|uniref:ACT domain-containing protein n=1 Tax=Eubacterium sp. TaxID=142586 RepID=UPI003A3B13F4